MLNRLWACSQTPVTSAPSEDGENAVPASGGGAVPGRLSICPLVMTGGAIGIVVAANDVAAHVDPERFLALVGGEKDTTPRRRSLSGEDGR